MLFRQDTLDGIAAGSVTLAFRRWRRLSVKPGTHLRTPIGVLVIESVERIEEAAIREDEAARAGFPSAGALLRELALHPEGELYRIAFHRGGADPRVALREADRLSSEELAVARERLRRLDARSTHGPWTAQTLDLIDRKPGIRAGDLAAEMGRERLSFKAGIRKLKELGLTESLEVGYRLSPRGKAFVATLRARASDPTS